MYTIYKTTYIHIYVEVIVGSGYLMARYLSWYTPTGIFLPK